MTRQATIILAKSTITSAATAEMETLAQALQARHPNDTIAFAFTEQGTPTLREVARALATQGHTDLLILPLLWPMEPGFRNWLTRSLQRWRGEWPTAPAIRIAQQPADSPAMLALLDHLRHGEAKTIADQPAPLEASQVPNQKHRVLVCQGGPCNNAGSALVWGHLRNEQKRLNLRTEGDGMMSAKTSCLGPCNLAPVVQVWPDGTWYGGVDEAGIDRIIHEHLIGGEPVQALAYPPLPTKQRLREPAERSVHAGDPSTPA